MKRYIICEISELVPAADNCLAREFHFASGESNIEGFVVQKNNEFRAYRNRCPHTGINLNWQPHQFFDVEGQYIQCSMHSAQFRFEDGECVWGPCLGQSLEQLNIEIDSGKIVLLLEE